MKKERLISPIPHIDIELMRLRLHLSTAQRVHSMMEAKEFIKGIARGRLRRRFPDLSDAEINLKMLEERDRVQKIPRPDFLS